MKVLVIGAAGRSGAELVTRALAHGHEVTAFVHDATEYTQTGVRLIGGDVLDADAIDAAVAGQDVVLDALGGKTPYKEATLETNAARNVVHAMQRHGVKRLIVISVLGTGTSAENTGFLYEHLLMPTYLHGAMKDKAGMEATVSSSPLDWTLVRPPMLTEGAATGSVEVLATEEQPTQTTAHKITRADLAEFIIKQISSDAYVRQAIVVTNN